MQVAVEEIEGMTAEPEVGRVYEGTVVSIKDFGCFVEFLPGKDGLCHISELSDKRVDKATDLVKEGDRIPVKLIGVDERGKVRLSRKAAMIDSGEIEAPAEDEGGNSKPEREVSDEEPEVGKLYQGTVVSREGVWRIRRIPARPRWPLPRQRVGQCPREKRGRHRQGG